MTASTWTGSRWAPLPLATPTRTPHHCADEPCHACARAIDAAEDARLGDDEWGWEMEERADREVWG